MFINIKVNRTVWGSDLKIFGGKFWRPQDLGVLDVGRSAFDTRHTLTEVPPFLVLPPLAPSSSPPPPPKMNKLGGVYMRKLPPERVSYWDDFFISYRVYIMTGSFHISLLAGTLHVDIKDTCKIQNRKHYTCATRSSLPADQFHTETFGRFTFT